MLTWQYCISLTNIMGRNKLQLLGFSLSARPLGEVLSSLALNATHKIFEISPKESLGDSVKVAALISDIRIVVTKRSAQEMAFIKAEDETGSIDLVVFPKVFERIRHILQENKAILVSGKIDTREENPTLLAEVIEDSDTLAETRNRLYIRIPSATTAEHLKKLKKLLVSNKGKSKVTLIFEGSVKRIDLAFGINWSEQLAIDISNVLSELPS